MRHRRHRNSRIDLLLEHRELLRARGHPLWVISAWHPEAARDLTDTSSALILDDGIYDFHTAFTQALPPFLASWISDGRDEEAVPVLSLLVTVNTSVRWALNNGVWAFGASSYADLVRKSADYTLDGIAGQITAPALVMDGENDQFLKGEPQKVRQALSSADATLVTLTIAEGAGEHTHAGAVSRAHQVMFDWLDTTLAR